MLPFPPHVSITSSSVVPGKIKQGSASPGSSTPPRKNLSLKLIPVILGQNFKMHVQFFLACLFQVVTTS